MDDDALPSLSTPRETCSGDAHCRLEPPRGRSNSLPSLSNESHISTNSPSVLPDVADAWTAGQRVTQIRRGGLGEFHEQARQILCNLYNSLEPVREQIAKFMGFRKQIKTSTIVARLCVIPNSTVKECCNPSRRIPKIRTRGRRKKCDGVVGLVRKGNMRVDGNRGTKRKVDNASAGFSSRASACSDAADEFDNV